MRINLYTESFKPYLSGVTVSVETYAEELVKLGHQVTTCAPAYPGYQDDESYQVFRFPSLGTSLYPGFRLALPFSLKHSRMIDAEKPDIIHSHSPFQLGLMSRNLARKKKIPFVYHFHTLFTEYLHLVKFIPQKISRPVTIKLIQKFCQECDLIVAPTERTKEILVEQYKLKQRIEVLPTGISDMAVVRANPAGLREKFGVKQDEFLLQYCGRLSREKNIEFLLSVFKLINEKVLETKLMIVAFGPQENELRKLSQELGIADRVIFTGRIERSAIYDYLKCADLFVCASKTETQGLVLSEAKACGKAAVAIKAGGVADMVKDGYDGYLCEDNLEEFKNRVLELINNRERLAEFSRNARRAAEANFLASAITKKLEKLYNNLR